MKSEILIDYLDDSFKAFATKDPSRNGMQIQAPAEVKKLGFAVDACMATLQKCSELSVDLLIVHHGLFWRNVELVVNQHYQRLKFALEHEIGLYAMHLPLDAHPVLGNNAQLAELFNPDETEPFAYEDGIDLGVIASFGSPVLRESISDVLRSELDSDPHVLPFGPDKVSKLGIISGAGGSYFPDAIDAGCDSFLTGEPEHVLYHVALERGVNVFFGGHYATETVGVKALMSTIAQEFDVETVFIDYPTGL